MADIEEKDDELVRGIRLAKTQPMNFVFVIAGMNDGILIISKKKIPVKKINEAKATCGGKKVFRGRCQMQDGVMTFETSKEPPTTLAKQIKFAVHRDAGITLTRVETKLTPELAEEDEDKLDGEATQEDVSAAEFAFRLRQMLPAIQEAQAGNSPQSQEIKLKASEAQTFGRNGEFAKANELLDVVATLIQQMAPTMTPEDGAVQWQNAVTRVTPDLKQALLRGGPLADSIKLYFSEAQLHSRKREFPQALKILSEVEKLVKQASATEAPSTSTTTSTAPPQSVPPLTQEQEAAFLQRWQPAKTAWQVASDKVDGQIANLQAAMKNCQIDEIVEVAEFGLNGVTGNHRVPLMAVMRGIDSSSGEARGKEIAKARQVVANFKQHLATSDLVAVCDDNPFEVPVSVHGTLIPALDKLAAALEV